MKFTEALLEVPIFGELIAVLVVVFFVISFLNALKVKSDSN